MIPANRLFLVLIALLALIVQACGSSVYDIPPDIDPEAAENVVLGINVVVGETPEGAEAVSRTFADSEDGTFENPVAEYEKLKTLRVIIVRPDGTVEHNRYVSFDIATGQIIRDNLDFVVKSGETKRIYLFGNEEAVEYNFTSDAIPVGSVFPVKAVENVTIKFPEGSLPPVNNGQTSLTRTYIPMSECFYVKIDTPMSEEDRHISRTLFITRSLIKFSFSVKNAVPYEIRSKLTAISISGLADRSFYLPNNTLYDPPKDQPSDYSLGGRYITSFRMPDGFGTTECKFPVLPAFDPDASDELTFDSYIYLPETKTRGNYQLRLLFDNQILSDALGHKSLDIRDIPRNTHVKVNITLKGSIYDVEVQMVPYTSVGLTPDFGLDLDKNLVPIYDENGELLCYYNKLTGKYYDKNNRYKEIPNPYLGKDPNTGYTIIRDDDGNLLYYYDETTGKYFDKDMNPIHNPYV